MKWYLTNEMTLQLKKMWYVEVLYVRRKKENKHGFERFSWIFCKVILLYILNQSILIILINNANFVVRCKKKKNRDGIIFRAGSKSLAKKYFRPQMKQYFQVTQFEYAPNFFNEIKFLRFKLYDSLRNILLLLYLADCGL